MYKPHCIILCGHHFAYLLNISAPRPIQMLSWAHHNVTHLLNLLNPTSHPGTLVRCSRRRT